MVKFQLKFVFRGSSKPLTKDNRSYWQAKFIGE